MSFQTNVKLFFVSGSVMAPDRFVFRWRFFFLNLGIVCSLRSQSIMPGIPLRSEKTGFRSATLLFFIFLEFRNPLRDGIHSAVDTVSGATVELYVLYIYIQTR